MATYVDDEGNEHEIELTLDEINAQKEKAEKADELSEKLRTQEEELSKLRNKDFNFRKFQEAKDQEKEDMLKGFSTRERELLMATESTSNELNAVKNNLLSDHKENILDSLAGGDKDLRKQIEDTAKTFVGEAHTKKELAERYTNAFTMIKGARPSVNVMNRYMPTIDGTDPTGASLKKKYTETPDGQNNYETWFPDSKKDK
jgi:hypothetical protein